MQNQTSICFFSSTSINAGERLESAELSLPLLALLNRRNMYQGEIIQQCKGGPANHSFQGNQRCFINPSSSPSQSFPNQFMEKEGMWIVFKKEVCRVIWLKSGQGLNELSSQCNHIITGFFLCCSSFLQLIFVALLGYLL